MARPFCVALLVCSLFWSGCTRTNEPAAEVAVTPEDSAGGTQASDEHKSLPKPGEGLAQGENSTDEIPQPDTTPPAPDPAADVAAAKQALVGTWELLSMNGREATDGERFVFTADSLTMALRGEQLATYQLDLTNSPHHLDIRIERGPQVVTALGIYEIRGDTLKICSGDRPGTNRPTAFDPAQGSLLRFKRFKSEVAEVLTIGREMPWVGSSAVAFHPSPPIVAATLGGRIMLWDLQANKKIDLIDPDLRSVGGLEFSADGEKLLACAGVLANGAEVFNVATLQSEHSLPKADSFARYSPDAALVATRGAKGFLELWDTGDWQLRHTFDAEDSQYVVDAAFNADGSRIAAVAPAASAAHIWNVGTGELVAKLEGKPWRAVAFHPDGNRIALTGDHGPTEIWDIAKKQQLVSLARSIDAGYVVFSPDGKQAASGAYLWDADTGEQVINLPRGPWGSGAGQIAFSPDGKLLGVSREHFVNIYGLDPSAAATAPTRWPPPLTPEQEAQRQTAEMLANINRGWAELRRGSHRNIVGEDGTPLLSWRVRLLPFLEQQQLAQQIDRKQAWDSDANAPVVAKGCWDFRSPGVDEDKTVWQMATGPGTWCPEKVPVLKLPDGAGTILVVQTSPERAVPWAAPQDFVFDPADPWTGLPKEGFLAIFANGTRFIPPDTPADVLKAMFSPDGGEEIDLDEHTQYTMDRFLYGP